MSSDHLHRSPPCPSRSPSITSRTIVTTDYRALAAGRPPAPGSALAHACRQLLADRRPCRALHQLAAGSARNYLARLNFREDARTARRGRSRRAAAVINPSTFSPNLTRPSSPSPTKPACARNCCPTSVAPPGKRLKDFLMTILRATVGSVDFLVDVNRRVQQAVGYVIRLEPGGAGSRTDAGTGAVRAAIRPGCWPRCCANRASPRASSPAT